MINAGKIGTLVGGRAAAYATALAANGMRSPFSIDPDSSASTIDWERWQGSVKQPDAAFQRRRFSSLAQILSALCRGH